MSNPEISQIDAVMDMVKTLGVPTVALFWLLWRTDRRIDRLTERIDDFTKNGKRIQ